MAALTKVLIANRGEIAVRIARACRELGISSVAVYSDADQGAPHVAAADEAVRIGPAAAAQSYLDVDALLAACETTAADAVHPGYGFLAENAAFAHRVVDAGLVFVGPPAEAIAAMGDKTAARTRMIAAGVPVVPGTEAALDSADAAQAAADEIGYPVLLKAAAGGGGKGMRVVADADELPAAFEAASREATQAFGDGRVYMERYLDAPRHIEIQVLADGHGRTIHLGERECSIQRRHQKLIEEAPSPALDAGTRAEMGAVAVAAAEAVDYVGAGTVEFLFQDGAFYFLEMNTRIQVEHPVTELVTGVDLVQWQLRIAAGEPLGELLGGKAGPVTPTGHAIECRIGGEDPTSGFLPATGTIGAIDLPSGPGVRWDGGIAAGTEVGLHYDPLLGKLLTWAPTRSGAIDRMRRALRELRISGVRTTIPFHLSVMDEPDFRSGDVSIRYLERHPDLVERTGDWAREAAIAAAVWLEQARRTGAGPGVARTAATTRPGGTERSAWRRTVERGA